MKISFVVSKGQRFQNSLATPFDLINITVFTFLTSLPFTIVLVMDIFVLSIDFYQCLNLIIFPSLYDSERCAFNQEAGSKSENRINQWRRMITQLGIPAHSFQT
jgi:hypothetical protein